MLSAGDSQRVAELMRETAAAKKVATQMGNSGHASRGLRAVVEAASSLSHEDEAYFREHYDNVPNRAADRAYDDVRPAYYLGQIASHNPNFLEREFTEVEPELERGWAEYSEKNGTWISVRDYAAEGFRRGRSKLDESARRAVAEQSARTTNELDDRRA